MMENDRKRDGIATVGWREWVALPELGIPGLKAKLDTGARTAALHAFQLEAFQEQGRLMVRFGIHPLRRRPKVEVYCVAEVVDRRVVSDSGGHRERRYVIRTPVALAGQTWPIEITLTNREDMLFRMLLGRTSLRGRFLVDPAKSYSAGRALAKSYRKRRPKTIAPDAEKKEV